MSAATDERIDRETETEKLRAMVHTLLGRVESLERTVATLKSRDQDARRAIGQLASAYGLTK